MMPLVRRLVLLAIATLGSMGLTAVPTRCTAEEPKAAAEAAPPSDSARFSPADLREDFRIARGAFEEAHPGIYRFTPKTEMDRVFDQAERGLDHPMTAWEFYRVMAPVVATIHCGHSRVELPEPLNQELNTSRRVLPLTVRVLDGRVWVLRDLSAVGEPLAGRELLAVNGVPASRLVATMLAASPHDGFGETMGPQTLRLMRFAGMLERLYGFDGRYQVTVRGARGGEQQVALEGAPVPALLDSLRRRHPRDVTPASNAELDLYDGGRVARLRLHGFHGTVSDSDTTDIRTFFRSSFTTLRERGTRTLILDLRDNGGGEDALGRILLSYLVDRPFDYYTDLVLNARTFSCVRYVARFDTIPADRVEHRADGHDHFVSHPNWGTQQPLEPHFAGRVLVLMNGASFSTTCEFLSHLRDLNRATFIGEESGGAYVGNTSGRILRVVLPHTQVQVGVPILRYDLAVRPAKPFGRGILADVKVPDTIEDLLAGRDPQLAKALALAK